MTNEPLISTKPEATAEHIKVKVIGIGGAGSNVLDRLVLDEAVDILTPLSDEPRVTVAAAACQSGSNMGAASIPPSVCPSATCQPLAIGTSTGE